MTKSNFKKCVYGIISLTSSQFRHRKKAPKYRHKIFPKILPPIKISGYASVKQVCFYESMSLTEHLHKRSFLTWT